MRIGVARCTSCGTSDCAGGIEAVGRLASARASSCPAVRVGRAAAGVVGIARSDRDGYGFMIVTPDVVSMIEGRSFTACTAFLSGQEMSGGSFAENSAHWLGM